MNTRLHFPVNGSLIPRAARRLLLGLALLLAVGGILRAQDGNSSPPMGPTGDYDGTVTTAGCYDAYTLNARRTVTDLTVPGSNGTYPLAFTRYSNSQNFALGTAPCFGDGGNWRHSYQWSASLYASTSGQPSAYQVGYPDGSVVVFRSKADPNYNRYAPSNEDPSFWRGPTGTNDRLQVANNQATLWRTDGGQVCFGTASQSASFYPARIIDPYGAITLLAYDPSGQYVKTVTEPGGRTLTFSYGTYSYKDTSKTYYWFVLLSVTASNGQSVSFVYNPCGTQSSGANAYYCGLQNVIYNAEPATGNPTAVSATATNPNACVLATYGYSQAGSNKPVLASAVDPHYAGAMTSIQYAFANAATGTIAAEQNPSTNESVSSVSQPAPSNGVTTSTEARGDKAAGGAAIKRALSYGQTNVTPAGRSSQPTYANAAMLTTRGDFEGNNTCYCYYGPGNANGSGTGNLWQVFDALGNSTTYVHEAITGKTTEFDLPDGRKRLWMYSNAANNNVLYPYYLQQSTDERGQNTIYHRYSNTGLVYQIDYPDQSHEYYQYQGFNGNGGAYYKVSLYQTRLGAQYTYSYGTNGNSGHNDLLLSVTRAYATAGGTASEKTSYQYDALDRLSQVTLPANSQGFAEITQNTYNGRHQLTRALHSSSDNTHVDYAYDDNGNRISASDEMQHVTKTAYDSYRRVTQVTVPINDNNSNKQATTYYEYVPRARDGSTLATATSHTRSTWGVSWAQSSKATEHVYSPNNWLTWNYQGIYVTSNGAGSPVTINEGSGYCASQVTSYSAVGQPLTVVDDNNGTTTYTYDNCGRKHTTTDPLGHVTTWTYYANNEAAVASGGNANCGGWLKSLATPGPDLNNYPTVTTTYADYDVNGHVKSTVDPWIHTFASAYDAAGDLTSQSDGDQASGQHVVGYGFDQLGRKTWVNDAVNTGNQESWTYDAAGNVATYKNFTGYTQTYQYDNRNRFSRYDWNPRSAASSMAKIFDAAGRVTEVANDHADIKYTYDDRGLVLTEAQQHYDANGTLTTTYYHDVDGNVTTLANPSGLSPDYAYDCRERCTGAYSGNTAFSADTYSGDWLTQRALGNGVYTTYGHQNNGRVTDVWHRTTDSQGNYKNISRHAYGYAPDGQITWFDREADGGSSGSSLENGCGDMYWYAPDGSLTNAARDVAATNGWPARLSATQDGEAPCSGSSFSYSSAADSYSSYYNYDAASNRTSVAQYNPSQQITYYPQGNNEYQYSTYDANYNTTNSAVGWTYTYDTENHLTGASGPSSQGMGFEYDGLGRLIVQNVNGVVTHFYYAGSQRVEERDASNDVLEDYMLDAPGGDQILLRSGKYGTIWYQYDLMGNTTHLTNNVGTVVEQYLYDCYGIPSVYNAAGAAQAGTTCDNRYLFKGARAYEWIAPMATYYCRARFYLPFHGRFLQPDPIGQQGGLNIYTYCHNDPVNASDPSGLEEDTSEAPKLSYTGDEGDDNDYDNGVDHTGETPTGSHIPNATENVGAYSYTYSPVAGEYRSGLSSMVGGLMENGTYEGIDVNGDIYARGTAVNGPTPPIGTTASITFPGFGGQYNSQTSSNGQFLAGVSGGGFIGDRYNIGMAEDYAQNMIRLGATGIAISGYSLGGAAAIELANDLSQMNISSVLTVDPVMLFGGSLHLNPIAGSSGNYYQTNGGLIGVVPGFWGKFGGTPVSGAGFNQLMPISTHPNMPTDVYITGKSVLGVQ